MKIVKRLVYVCACVVRVCRRRRVVAKEKKSNVRRAVKKREVRRKEGSGQRKRGAVCQLAASPLDYERERRR